jgi:hypothetical protein
MIGAMRQIKDRRDQYGTDIVAQIRALQCPMSDRRTGPLLTSGKCRARADEKFAQAERDRKIKSGFSLPLEAGFFSLGK